MAYTDEQKAEAVRVYVDTGNLHEAARTCGAAPNSVKNWAITEGHDPETIGARASEKTANATAARLARLGEERADLALGLMDDIAKLRGQLFTPCVEKRVVTLAGSKDQVGTWELVEIDRDQPTFVEQKAIMTTLAIAVDKVQILTGEATERIDHRQIPDRTPEQEAEMDRTLRIVREQRAA